MHKMFGFSQMLAIVSILTGVWKKPETCRVHSKSEHFIPSLQMNLSRNFPNEPYKSQDISKHICYNKTIVPEQNILDHFPLAKTKLVYRAGELI